MNKEFLEDYNASEGEEINKFVRKLREGKIRYGDRYPPPKRLKLNELYTKSVAGEKIFSIIPLHGTVVIPLRPVKKYLFEKVHGFDIDDIDRLIESAKTTGRIQFVLDFDENPIDYRHLDLLEPIFTDPDLRPPKLIHIPLNAILSDEEIKKAYNEIEHLLENPRSQKFIRGYIEKKYSNGSVHTQKDVKDGIIRDMIRLKHTGYEDLIRDFIQGLTSIDTTKITFLLDSIHDLFFFTHDPLRGIRSCKRENLFELFRLFSFGRKFSEGIEFPYEVGRFLNRELPLIYAKNMDGAIEISDKYELYDLRKVMNALNEAIENEKVDMINEKSGEISTIFENVWSEADKLRNKVNNFAKYGVSMGIAGLGSVVAVQRGGGG